MEKHNSHSLLFLGSSECDQSGIPVSTANDNTPDDYMRIMTRPTKAWSENVLEITCGAFHTLVITTNHLLYSWGCGDCGELGREGSNETPEIVPLPGPALNVSAGDTHSMAIVMEKSGKQVYSWGAFRNFDGQMGEKKNTPTLISEHLYLFQTPVKVVSGCNHAILMTLATNYNHKLYSVGDFYSGKLGRSPGHRRALENSLQLKAVKCKKPAEVWACDNHSFYLDEKGQLWGWGLNVYGQLGLGHEKEVNFPEEVIALSDKSISKISGGDMFTLFLDREGKVYATGSNIDGQLGLNPTDLPSTSTPIPVPLNPIVSKIYACADFAYCLSEDGTPYCWGSGLNYVLATRNENSVTSPRELSRELFSDKKVVEIATGAQHVIFLVENKNNNLRKMSESETPSRSAKRTKKFK